MESNNRINEVVEALLRVKEELAVARDKRIELEKQLCEIIGNTAAEGSKLKTTDKFNVSISNKLKRVLDAAEYELVKDGIPEGCQFVVYKPAIDLKKFRHLEAVDPVLASKFVTTSPQKPSITIKPLV